MNAVWKKKAKPNIVLKRIEESKSVTADGKVSYSGFEFYDAMATVQGMVDFTDRSKTLEIDLIIWSAINNIAKNQVLEQKKVIDEINRLIKEEHKTKEREFHVLTTLSLGKPFPFRSITIEGSKIYFLDKDFPKKYEGRKTTLQNQIEVSDVTPDSYTKVIVTVKSKSVKGAATKALRLIDIQRAIWSVFANSSMWLFGNEWKPINKIRMGCVHTVHEVNGKNSDEQFWYEPNFTKADPYKPDDLSEFKKSHNFVHSKLRRIAYSPHMSDALIRFVRALDERDQNVALIKLWGALESLTCPSDANYELVTRRCSFLFKDHEYHRQVLEHLRDYRNRSVHSGDQSENAKSKCYQLKYYFETLILFHLSFAGKFQSLEEANSFLDSSKDVADLLRKKQLIEYAIKYLS